MDKKKIEKLVAIILTTIISLAASVAACIAAPDNDAGSQEQPIAAVVLEV